MNKTYYLIFLLIISVLLCACGRQVEVVQSQQFKLMADRMPNELMARDILDSSRDYVPGVWEETPKSYGDILYKRLSPAFLFGDVVTVQDGNSFYEIVSAKPEENSAVMRTHGFSVVTVQKEKTKSRRKRKSSTKLERRVDVDMVAITDWNGNGQKDWIITCKVLRTRGAVPRIYYIVVPNPTSSGMLQGSVVAVYDDMGAFGRLYMRESLNQTQAPVEDTVPGLKAVTTPPKASPAKPASTIKERTLD